MGVRNSKMEGCGLDSLESGRVQRWAIVSTATSLRVLGTSNSFRDRPVCWQKKHAPSVAGSQTWRPHRRCALTHTTPFGHYIYRVWPGSRSARLAPSEKKTFLPYGEKVESGIKFQESALQTPCCQSLCGAGMEYYGLWVLYPDTWAHLFMVHLTTLSRLWGGHPRVATNVTSLRWPYWP